MAENTPVHFKKTKTKRIEKTEKNTIKLCTGLNFSTSSPSRAHSMSSRVVLQRSARPSSQRWTGHHHSGGPTLWNDSLHCFSLPSRFYSFRILVISLSAHSFPPFHLPAAARPKDRPWLIGGVYCPGNKYKTPSLQNT